jgi:hypothetical protein
VSGGEYAGVPTVETQLKVLTEKLVLTADQQDKIKSILKDLHDATDRLMQDKSLSREERLTKVRPERYKADERIRADLNEEQKKKLDEYEQGPHSEVHGTLSGATDPFEQMKSLAGEWQADLPGFGQINDSIRLVSKVTAVEETLGTQADNEVSLYTRDGKRLLLTHFCALTVDGHVVRLETTARQRAPGRIELTLVAASNLHDEAAPHMRRVRITFIDRDHFNEKWTKTEKGVDTVFDMTFSRLAPQP